MNCSLANPHQILSKISLIFVFLFFGAIEVHGESEPPVAPEQSKRLEQLYLWKISEELKLSVKQEQILLELTQKISTQRNRLQEAHQLSLKNLNAIQSPKALDAELKVHRKILKDQMELQLQEFDQIKKAFGSEKAARYFVVKNELLLKLKSLLLSPNKNSTTK